MKILFITAVSLLTFLIVPVTQQYAQGVPNPACLGSCPTPTNAPSYQPAPSLSQQPYNQGNNNSAHLDTPNKITVPVNGGYDFPLDQGPQGLINRALDWAKTLMGGKQQSYGQAATGGQQQSYGQQQSLHQQSYGNTTSGGQQSTGQPSYNGENNSAHLDTPNKITVPVNGGYDFPLDQGPQGLINRGLDWAKTLIGGQSSTGKGSSSGNQGGY